MIVIPLIALVAGANATVAVMPVDPLLGTGNGSLCVLDPRQQAAFDALFDMPHRARPSISTVRRRLSPNSVETRSRADFPSARDWNGLPLIAAERVTVVNAESEGMQSRSLVFRLSLRRLQTALRKLGVPVPAAPKFMRVEVEPFGGAANLATRPGESMLTCAWDT